MTTLVLNDILLPAATAATVPGVRAPRMLALPSRMPQPLELDALERSALEEAGLLVQRTGTVPAGLLSQVAHALARAMAPVDEYVERTIRNLMRQAGAPSGERSQSVH